MRPPKRAPRATPTRADLDKRNPKRGALIALVTAAALVALAATWWARNGSAFMSELTFRIETLYVYWNLVATPLDRKVWTMIAIALVLILIVAVFLLHRFVWRAIFPDFMRLDPRAHAGGRPERIGRLYRVREFRDEAERTCYRHYYKHGDRWFPLFRLDYVDLAKPAESLVYGVALARCGRLERDSDGSRFKRIATDGPFASQPLETTFRQEEVTDDQLRKTSIVGPGPGMNPEVMRRKWQSEPSMLPRLEQQSRALLGKYSPGQDPRIAPPPPEERP